MAVTLDISGKNMYLKALRGPDWEENRDKIKKLADKKPRYELVDGYSKFTHWEVPVTELGNLIDLVGVKGILPQGPKAQKAIDDYVFDTIDIAELPLYKGEIKHKRPPKNADQEAYIRIDLRKTRLIAAVSPGGGKTYISLSRATLLGGKKLLVVGPSKNNFTTWRSEVEKTTDFTTIKYHGTPKQRKKLLEEVDNYEVVYTTYTMVHELVGKQFDQVIMDEAHVLAHETTKLFKNASKIMKSLPNAGLQLLSGTPIQHKPKDLWALVHLINPVIAGQKSSWVNMYEKVVKSIYKNVPIKTGNGYALDEKGRVKTRRIEIPIKVEPCNLDHLRNRTKSLIYRKTIKDHVNFEDIVDVQLVEMLPRQLEMYREAREELFLELSNKQLKLSANMLGRITRFLQICEGCFNLDENIKDSGKFDYLFDQLDQADDKRIVWRKFKTGTDYLLDRYKDRAVVYNGDLTQIQRDVAIWNFQGCETKQDYEEWEKHNKTKFTEPGQAQFLFGVMDKGASAGRNLPACSHQYFTSLDWNGNINAQTAARIARLNQMADEIYTEIILTEVPGTHFEENAYRLIMNNYLVTLGILDGIESKSYTEVQNLLKII